MTAIPIEQERTIVFLAKRLGISLGQRVHAEAALDVTPGDAPWREAREEAMAAAKRDVFEARADMRDAIRDAYEGRWAHHGIMAEFRDAYPEDAP